MYFYVKTIILHAIIFYRLIFTGEKEDNMPIAMSFILGVADKKLSGVVASLVLCSV
jgi:hypothetical protein